MYDTSINYKKNIYTCRQHELKIYIDEQRVNDSYIFDFNSNYELLTDKIELGSTPMQQIELTLHKDAIPNTHQEIYIESGILNGEIVPVGYFTIVDIQDENEYTTKIVANDYMDKFEFNFDGSNYVPCSTGALLSYICNQAGVELATPTFLNSNVVINVYDNTMSARKFISMIAEQAGGFACIGRDGKLYIKSFENASYIENYNNQTHIDLETSVNATANIIKIYGNEDGLSGTVDLCIDEVEKSIYLVDLFKQVYVNLLNGNLNISLPSELADIVEYSLDSNGNLIAYVYDIYGNKLDFSIDISGNLIADIDLESRVVISRNKITINLGSFVLGEYDYIEYDSITEKWYIFQNNTSTEITNTTVLNSLNQLLDISLNKGTIEIYLGNDVSAISMNCTNFVEIPIELFKEYEFSKELFKCTRLYYEDGIRSFDYGNQTGNTIYVDSDNMFIVDDGNDTSTQLQNVFNKINGLELRGFKGCSIVDIAIDIGDIVYIDGKPVLYQGSWEYQGKNKVSISSEIQSKSKEESTIVKVSTDVKIRRLQSSIDQLNGTITLLAQQVSGNSQNISSLEINVNQIVSKIENDIDITREVFGLKKITLENCMRGELLELRILGNDNVFDSQFLSDELYLDDDVYLFGDSLIKLNSTNLREDVEYITGNLDKNTGGFNTGLLACKSLIVPIQQNRKITVQKDAGKRFAIATYTNYPEPLEISNHYVSDENEGEGLTKLEIDSTEDDNYLVVFFYDGNIDNENLEEMYESIIIYEDYQEIELGIDTVLRKYGEIFDEYVLSDGKARIIRRIGLDNNGNKYILQDEQIEELGAFKINVYQGKNTIEIANYEANISAKFAIINDFSRSFATTIELHSTIEQLVDRIVLLVSKKVDEDTFYSTIQLLTQSILLQVASKVGNNEIIAKLNLAVLDEQAIIELVGNIVKIISDNFTLNEDGSIIAKKGTIAGWNITINELKKGLAGLVAVGEDEIQSYKEVIYVGKGLGKDGNSVFSVNSVGDVRANSIYLYALSNNDRNPANIKLYSASEQVGTDITADTVATGHLIAGDGIKKGYCMHSPDIDLNLNNTYFCHHTGSDLVFNINPTVDTDFNTGPYWIHTNSSDERLKHNIESLDDNLLQAINEIEIKQFVFNNDKNGKINTGIVAQELITICEKYELNIFNYDIVKYGITFPNDVNKYFAIDYTQLLLIKTKCLEKRIEKIEEMIANGF